MKRVFKNGILLATMIMFVMTGCNKILNDEGNGDGMLKINGQEYSLTESYMTVRNGTHVSSINFQKKDENHVILTLKNPIELTSIYTEADFVIESVDIVIYETMFMFVESIMIPIISETSYSDTEDFKISLDIKDKTCEIFINGKAKERYEKNPNYDYNMSFKGTIRVARD